MSEATMSKPPPLEEGGEDTTGKTTTIKTVYLIRHAESEENRRLGALRNAFLSLRQLSLPAMNDLKASAELVNIPAQVDSGVSPIGHEQIKSMANILHQENFVQAAGIQLVVHSPLERARETCFGMLQCRAATATTTENHDDDDDASSSDSNTNCHGVQQHAAVQRVEELHLLLEKTPLEWVPVSAMTQQFRGRIAAFEDWLHEQPETVVAVVGHSQYFRAMLNLPYKFGNCDVYKVQFDYAASRRRELGNADDPTTTTSTADPQQESATSGSVASTTIKSFANWMPSIMKRGNDDASAPAAAAAAASPLDNGEQQSSFFINSTSNSYGVSSPLPPQWSGLELLYKCSIVSNKDEKNDDDDDAL